MSRTKYVKNVRHLSSNQCQKMVFNRMSIVLFFKENLRNENIKMKTVKKENYKEYITLR